MHYHVMSTVGITTPVASLTFDNYEESMEMFVRLSNQLFSHLMEPDATSALQRAREAMEADDSMGSFSGTQAMGFVWQRCEEDQCLTATWN